MARRGGREAGMGKWEDEGTRDKEMINYGIEGEDTR